MNNKVQKIFNYYNANKNLKTIENNRFNALQKIKPPGQLLMKFSNEEKEKEEISNVDIFNINDVYNRNIKCLCNVYQEKYKKNINATGFGDFIRGCYFLLDFCDKFNIKLQILINHPVNMFLKTGFINDKTLNIPFFVKNNWDGYHIDEQNNLHSIPGKFITSKFISYLKEDVAVINRIAYIYTIAYPMNIIQDKHKFVIQKLFEPNDEMKTYINTTIEKYELVKKDYIVFHIRTGDSYLTAEKKELRGDYVKKIVGEIAKILSYQRENKKYVIISDNNDIKQIINGLFPNFICIFNEITHFGEGVLLEKEKVKNTMLDFYIMALSKQIYSFSSYKHGTGFSQWCAETYNIPYSCKFITI